MQAFDKPVEDVNKIRANPQGGKAFGHKLKVQESDLDRIGQEFMCKNSQVTPELLEKYKQKFMLYDTNHNGELGLEEVKFMMEKLGQPKTHLELKKMIAQVDKSGSGTIECVLFLFRDDERKIQEGRPLFLYIHPLPYTGMWNSLR